VPSGEDVDITPSPFWVNRSARFMVAAPFDFIVLFQFQIKDDIKAARIEAARRT
jgi:hypothetical protein